MLFTLLVSNVIHCVQMVMIYLIEKLAILSSGYYSPFGNDLNSNSPLCPIYISMPINVCHFKRSTDLFAYNNRY